jgi:putative membrane protein
MKNSFVTHLTILASVTALNLAFLPSASAQAGAAPSNPTGSSENSKADESSTAEQHDAALSTATDQNGTLDKTPTKTPSGPSTDPNKTTTALNEQSGASENKNNSSLVKSDQKFIQDAAQGGMTEVQLGRIAEEKGASADVKQFGSRMVSDHSRADGELQSLAQQKGVSVPKALDHKHQAMVDHFRKLSGPAFDRAYVHNMVKDHREDAAEFQKAAASANDPDVKAFASKTLGVIKSHLAEVQDIQSKIQK